MVIEALEALIQAKREQSDTIEYNNLLNWVKIKSKDKF